MKTILAHTQADRALAEIVCSYRMGFGRRSIACPHPWLAAVPCQRTTRRAGILHGQWLIEFRTGDPA